MFGLLFITIFADCLSPDSPPASYGYGGGSTFMHPIHQNHAHAFDHHRRMNQQMMLNQMRFTSMAMGPPRMPPSVYRPGRF